MSENPTKNNIFLLAAHSVFENLQQVLSITFSSIKMAVLIPYFLYSCKKIFTTFYFKDLDKEDILKIVDLELIKTINRAKGIGYDVTITDSCKDHLIEVGYDPKYGARPLKRAIQRWIDDEITDFIITNSPNEGDKFLVDYNVDKDSTVITLDGKAKKTRKKKEE